MDPQTLADRLARLEAAVRPFLAARRRWMDWAHARAGPPPLGDDPPAVPFDAGEPDWAAFDPAEFFGLTPADFDALDRAVTGGAP